MLKLLEVVTVQPGLVAVFVFFLIGAHQVMYLTEVSYMSWCFVYSLSSSKDS